MLFFFAICGASCVIIHPVDVSIGEIAFFDQILPLYFLYPV